MVKRVLFVDHADGLGGAERSLLLLMSHLSKDKWEPHFAGTNGRFLSEVKQANIPAYPVTLPRLRRSVHFPGDWWRGAQAIAAVAKQVQADFLHANTIRAAMYTAIAAKLAKRPFIWHMRDFWLSENKPSRLWLDTTGKRSLIASAKHVIVNSHSVAQHLPPSEKISVVHNGIDLTQFNLQMDGAPFRQKYSIPLDVPLAGMMARLRPWKGQTRFIEMAKEVRERMPDAWFIIAGGAVFGDGDNYLQQLQQLSCDLGLEDRLIFTGHLDDVRPVLAALDVFVHPGDPEPFGLVNVEAMAMGKPVVAFAHGALPEIVIQDETGILVPPGKIAELATAVVNLVSDEALAKRLGMAGYDRATQQFSIARTVNEFERILTTEGV